MFFECTKYLYADENRELIKSETLIISNSWFASELWAKLSIVAATHNAPNEAMVIWAEQQLCWSPNSWINHWSRWRKYADNSKNPLTNKLIISERIPIIKISPIRLDESPLIIELRSESVVEIKGNNEIPQSKIG